MRLGEKLAALYERFCDRDECVVHVIEPIRLLWLIPFPRSRGWLSIEDDGDHWSVLWTSGRDTHNATWGPAYGADVRKDTGDRRVAYGLTGAWRSALSLLPVRDNAEAERIFSRTQHLIELAYRWHVERPLHRKIDIIPSVRG